MQRKPIIQFFVKGFFLANGSLDILLISLLLSMPSLLNSFAPNATFGKVLSPLSFILLFISIGFTLSIPIFLLQKQQQKVLDYRELARLVLKNTKRIIIPIILLFILIALLLVLSFVFIAVFTHLDRDQVITFFQNFGKGWQPIFVISIVLISFLKFTPFFFSLEHKGLLSSIKNSIVVGFKNLQYIGLVILIGIISYSITSFIPIGTLWGQSIRSLVGLYINLLLTASSLLYYQNVIKQDKMA